MAKQNVLFLCTGNSARSQMAEAMLRRFDNVHFNAFSAGSEARGIHPLTVKVMEEAGYDLHDQYSKPISEFFNTHHGFDHVVIVCRRNDEGCPTVFPQAKRHRFLLNDPVKAQGTEEEKLQAFRAVRDQLDSRLKLWVDETLELIGAE